MGFKRPYDDEKLHELPLKHSRQFGYSDKSSQFEESFPHHAISQKSVATVNEGDLCKPQGGESSDGETFDEGSNFVYSDLEMDGAFAWSSKGCDEEGATHSPHSVKYIELSIPQRVFAPVETFYSFLLDQPARKQVPIGPGHQAIIPEWEGSQNENLVPSSMLVRSRIIGCADGEKLSGICVVPMPDLNTPARMDEIVGKGREFCVCQDQGSTTCVRQHIKEAREEMVKMLGYDKFRDLGFCDMGEEVARNWSDEDALLFHEVVYSNPVTLGQNFWNHLEAVFSSRSKMEMVSYYFNVFVLRRRATQNRNLMLDIDSDDDEWQRGYGGPLGTHFVEEDEEDSATESPLCQGSENFNEKVHPLHQKEGEEDASISENDKYDNVYTHECDTGLCEEHKMNATVEYMNRFSGSNEERLNVEDDSCTTFEHAHDAVIGLGDHQKKLECNDPMNPKVSRNDKHLQPTGSIMEEIFGHGSCENKVKNK